MWPESPWGLIALIVGTWSEPSKYPNRFVDRLLSLSLKGWPQRWPSSKLDDLFVAYLVVSIHAVPLRTENWSVHSL